ncbi:hypothetical protein IWX48DRAFT_619713 [Phyllosticta citricarpa]
MCFPCSFLRPLCLSSTAFCNQSGADGCIVEETGESFRFAKLTRRAWEQYDAAHISLTTFVTSWDTMAAVRAGLLCCHGPRREDGVQMLG